MADFDWHSDPLTGDTRITANYRTTQNMRRFMRAHIPDFTFSRDFMAWIRANEGITLDAVVTEAKRRTDQK
ncbi:DUF6434 domain-containing protein [Yoonia algicola]|uniref:DUF6434 domain-containing protein n=1 Tax=Yoonia algicola TaxID=3137368 RepID=A0AAN0MBL2_9RHOB